MSEMNDAFNFDHAAHKAAHKEDIQTVRSLLVSKYPRVMFSEEFVTLLLEFHALYDFPSREATSLDTLIEVIAGEPPCSHSERS